MQAVVCHCGYDIFQTRVSHDLIELKCDRCGTEYQTQIVVKGHTLPNEWSRPARKNVITAASTKYR